MDWSLLPVFLLLGCVVGVLAGLLGIGGGMTIVPVLTFVFTREGFPLAHVVHLAIGTSMATIMFTSISSVRAHHAHGAVLWPVFRAIAPGILLASVLGPQVVGAMKTPWVAAFFGSFAAFSAVQMLLDKKPHAARQLPGPWGLFAVGNGIGFISSMVGAGGGFISVPFMAWCNVKIHNAVATSAALGLPIAVAGTVGYVIAGLRTEGLPPHTIGYVHWPALLGIVVASVLFAPTGARLAHAWPVKKLKKAFAGMLFVLSAYMLWKAASTW
ncbi:MAG: sulfite exporter TauE/SafE family protein [Betaproteobacteria bacterium]|nr:sulfite exporter TauE/SafE family protein [Betaproteobacteria bacterium]